MDRPTLAVPVGPADRADLTADRVAPLTRALRAALDGVGPALEPVTADDDATAGRPTANRVPGPVALVLATSGSTGEPRRVMLDAAALRASVEATHTRLGGPGRWLLTLPLGHVAGLQVLVRSVVAGTEPLLAPPGPFDPAALAALVRGATAPGTAPLYTSLVPTQLHRVLAAAGKSDDLPEALAPLRGLDAILVGGAATSVRDLDRARALGLRVVTTYGMTETCGGCVYDGVPLDGVDVRLRGGRVEIAGPVLARGHLGRPDLDAEVFVTDEGRRWLRTSDRGELREGRLHVLGRADDVLLSGGVNVSPQAVEEALAALGLHACVVGVPDAEWGQAVTAVVVLGADGSGTAGGTPDPGAPSLADVRAHVARSLGPAAAPRHLLVVDGLPLRGPGKVDRAEVARRARAMLDAENRG